MASRAFERAQKILGNPTEEQLAQLIMHDISAQSANAEDHGVLAYARKPVHREKPNERFLLGTIRSVAFANRKAEEDEMWNQRNYRLSISSDDRRQGGMRSDRMTQHAHEYNGRSPYPHPHPHDPHTSTDSQSDEEGSEAHSAAEVPMSDEQLAEILSRKRIRGRGGIGSRVDEAGPFLPASAAADDELLIDRQPARPAGPNRPSWLPRSSGPSPDKPGSCPVDKHKEKLKTEKLKTDKKHKKGKKHKEKRRRAKEREAVKKCREA